MPLVHLRLSNLLDNFPSTLQTLDCQHVEALHHVFVFILSLPQAHYQLLK